MAKRPLAFGIRFKDTRGSGRSVQLRAGERGSGGYVTEVRRGRKTERSEHGSLGGALGAFASAWRSRLN